jgi:hypothetical protein
MEQINDSPVLTPVNTRPSVSLPEYFNANLQAAQSYIKTMIFSDSDSLNTPTSIDSENIKWLLFCIIINDYNPWNLSMLTFFLNTFIDREDKTSTVPPTLTTSYNRLRYNLEKEFNISIAPLQPNFNHTQNNTFKDTLHYVQQGTSTIWALAVLFFALQMLHLCISAIRKCYLKHYRNQADEADPVDYFTYKKILNKFDYPVLLTLITMSTYAHLNAYETQSMKIINENNHNRIFNDNPFANLTANSTLACYPIKNQIWPLELFTMSFPCDELSITQGISAFSYIYIPAIFTMQPYALYKAITAIMYFSIKVLRLSIPKLNSWLKHIATNNLHVKQTRMLTDLKIQGVVAKYMLSQTNTYQYYLTIHNRRSTANTTPNHPARQNYSLKQVMTYFFNLLQEALATFNKTYSLLAYPVCAYAFYSLLHGAITSYSNSSTCASIAELQFQTNCFGNSDAILSEHHNHTSTSVNLEYFSTYMNKTAPLEMGVTARLTIILSTIAAIKLTSAYMHNQLSVKNIIRNITKGFSFYVLTCSILLVSAVLMPFQNTSTTQTIKRITVTTNSTTGIDLLSYHQTSGDTNGNLIYTYSSPPNIEVNKIYPALIYSAEASMVIAAGYTLLNQLSKIYPSINKCIRHPKIIKNIDLLHLSTKSAITSTLHQNSFFFMFMLFVTALQSGINESGENWDYITATLNFLKISQENIHASPHRNMTEIENMAKSVYTIQGTTQLIAWASSVIFITTNIVRKTTLNFLHLIKNENQNTNTQTEVATAATAAESKSHINENNPQPSAETNNKSNRGKNCCEKFISLFSKDTSNNSDYQRLSDITNAV